ncbi:hypothetical protein PAJ34TS1_53720 [Paenibacillus azoreducens]|uniref:Uncharacterized protein n=1 Tax=Paenibacillus azoreducens TaxID=116718 RepID=A0A919YIR6_9BACL|nr:hypothetical protein J34TS1_61860 [Paenibacillus azoreducens]
MVWAYLIGIGENPALDCFDIGPGHVLLCILLSDTVETHYKDLSQGCVDMTYILQ